MKCKKCGSEDFYLTEELLWSCYVEDNKLECNNKGGDIKDIVCKECGEECSESDFSEIVFD